MSTLTFLFAAISVVRVNALDNAAWKASEWIADPKAPIADETTKKAQRAADGTSWFIGAFTNEKVVTKALWMTTALGVYELYVNGQNIGSEDALKPGFTHPKKTRRSFAYDITDVVRTAKGASNAFAAEVSSGWWRDKISGYAGQRSAFRGVVAITYEDGTQALYGTRAGTWQAATGGCVTHAGIFDGEEYDARQTIPTKGYPAIASTEFKGEILPDNGAEICRREDLALKPVEAYCWQGVEGADAAKSVFGRVKKTHVFKKGETLRVTPGETLVVDFGQNCAGVPAFAFKSERGAVLTCLPGEMLNDANGEKSRGNDGPGGSLYRDNLRIADTGMRNVYTFATDKVETYMARFTFFGYRYVSITATKAVTIERLFSVPVTSITKEMERGTIETGDKDVNRLISNVYWGQLSNYLSVPTDCPQRNERLGWTADTQVFTEAGSFNADTSRFFHKWTKDLRDSQSPLGGYPGTAPMAQYGGECMRLGWSDAGVIVPYQIWKQFGDTTIVDENWESMEKLLTRLNESKAMHTDPTNLKQNTNYQWGDWLSFEKLESSGRSAFAGGKPKPEAVVYWNYLAACYWMWDAQMMAAMAKATGRDTAKWKKMTEEAKAYLVANFFEKDDGLILKGYRDMQTPALFALKLGLVEGAAKEATLAALRENVKSKKGCLATGFLGTSILMDTLTELGAADLAYNLLLNHGHPGWLYSVDQGATTIWERWNSYTKERGFGPVWMNSFNHYAYGAVLAWIYKTAAGISADPNDPGFKTIVMKPIPDRRLGYVKAQYKSAAGLIKSAWRYEGDQWIWQFSVPDGATARVTLPGETTAKEYAAGDHKVVCTLK